MENLKQDIDKERIPEHIGIIMDGNGRWAEKRGLPRYMGHREGAKRVVEIVEAAYGLGIKSLSIYAFSTENWKRPEDEISKLMELLIIYIRTWLKKIMKNNVKINVMGDISQIPLKAQKEVKRALELTKNNDKMILNVGLNYGGQNEIVKAVKDISKAYKEGIIDIEEINEENFNDYLYTKGQSPLDLLIRPSGEFRVSNFMLYQLAYSEFRFSNILWPDFTEEELYKAIIDYQKRDRRFGGI